jgi:hypothetical protein
MIFNALNSFRYIKILQHENLVLFDQFFDSFLFFRAGNKSGKMGG